MTRVSLKKFPAARLGSGAEPSVSDAFRANLAQRKSPRNKGFRPVSRQLRYLSQSLCQLRFEMKSRGRPKALNLFRFGRYCSRHRSHTTPASGVENGAGVAPGISRSAVRFAFTAELLRKSGVACAQRSAAQENRIVLSEEWLWGR